MKKFLNIVLAAVLGVAAVACSSAEKMAKDAENVTVVCTPSPLECVAGQVTAQVAVTYPDGYFHPKAILEVTPVIVYEGGEVAAPVLTYQGEKVKNNYKVVPKSGSTVKETIKFDYVPGMEKSYMELRGVAVMKNKSVTLPTKKVADGGLEITDYESFASQMDRLAKDADYLKAQGEQAGRFVESLSGATEKVLAATLQ